MTEQDKRNERVERVKKSVAEQEAKQREQFQNIKEAPKSLTEFKAKYPDYKALSLLDSNTATCYLAGHFVWMFDNHKDDEHLAFLYDCTTHKTLYECSCIIKGRAIAKEMLGIDFNFEEYMDETIDAIIKQYGGNKTQ